MEWPLGSAYESSPVQVINKRLSKIESPSRYVSVKLKPCQLISIFNVRVLFKGTFQIGRKDRLWRNIQRFMNKFGKEEFGFMPKTFVLPIETKQLKQAWDSADSKNQLWIVKPVSIYSYSNS